MNLVRTIDKQDKRRGPALDLGGVIKFYASFTGIRRRVGLDGFSQDPVNLARGDPGCILREDLLERLEKFLDP